MEVHYGQTLLSTRDADAVFTVNLILLRLQENEKLKDRASGEWNKTSDEMKQSLRAAAQICFEAGTIDQAARDKYFESGMSHNFSQKTLSVYFDFFFLSTCTAIIV